MRKLLMFVGLTLAISVLSFVGVQALTAKPSAPSTSCQGTCVDLTDHGMSPDAISIKVGEFVQFNSKDGKTHNISLGEGAHEASTHEDDGHEHEAHDVTPHQHTGGYASGDFGADEAWRVQFKKTGTYTLHDHYNPKLYITVVVYQPGGDTTIR